MQTHQEVLRFLLGGANLCTHLQYFHLYPTDTPTSNAERIYFLAGAVEVQHNSQNILQLGICAAEGLAITGNIVLTFSIFAYRRLDANILMAPFQFLAR